MYSGTNVFFLPVFFSVFHVVLPSSPAHIPRQPCGSAPRQPSPASFTSLASSRLQDKHQKLKESRRASSFLASLPPLPPSSSSSSPDPHPFRCRDDDLSKPKGKRPCKTKHTGGETVREERDGGGTDDEEKSGKVSEERLFSFVTVIIIMEVSQSLKGQLTQSFLSFPPGKSLLPMEVNGI